MPDCQIDAVEPPVAGNVFEPWAGVNAWVAGWKYATVTKADGQTAPFPLALGV